jgi:hypothetical protein
MNELFEQTIGLVKNSLAMEKHPLRVDREVYDVCKENGILGFVYPALDESLVDKETFSLFKEEYYQYIKKDQRQISVLEELKEIFNKEDIDFVFLKGSFLKTIYPKSFMRSMGDIDVLIRPSMMEKAHIVLEENGYKNWVMSTNHDCFIKYANINVEVHPKLDSEFSNEYKVLFEKPWENVVHYKLNEYHLAIEYNLFYQLYHMIKHLYSSGVGFRTIIDIFLFVEKYEVDFNLKKIEELLKYFPKKEFFYNIFTCINQIFSKDLLQEFSQYGKMQKAQIEEFTNFLFVSGIHGIGKHHNLFIGGIANNAKKSKNILSGKIKYLLSKVFLSYSQMKGIYPVLNKWKILLPFAWVLRALRLVFAKRKNTFRKLKRFSVKKEEVIKIEKLFDDIGI